MKSAVLAICCLALGGIASGQGQQKRYSIQSGEGYEKPTQVYETKAPYTLKWHAESSFNARYKYDQNYRTREGMCDIRVYDAATDKVIVSAGSALDGEVFVPVAGRHYLRVFTLGRWETSYVEQKVVKAPPAAEKKPAATTDEKTASGLDSIEEEKRFQVEKKSILGTLEILAQSVESSGDKPKAAIARKIADEVAQAAPSQNAEAFRESVKRSYVKLQDAGILEGGPKPSSDPSLPPGMERRKPRTAPTVPGR